MQGQGQLRLGENRPTGRGGQFQTGIDQVARRHQIGRIAQQAEPGHQGSRKDFAPQPFAGGLFEPFAGIGKLLLHRGKVLFVSSGAETGIDLGGNQRGGAAILRGGQPGGPQNEGGSHRQSDRPAKQLRWPNGCVRQGMDRSRAVGRRCVLIHAHAYQSAQMLKPRSSRSSPMPSVSSSSLLVRSGTNSPVASIAGFASL